ncbi:MAG TPA: hypothetical protein VI542_23240 [Candidatus Tectomicrobia bacterium]
MTIVTQYDWESDTFTHHAEHGVRQAWREAVAQVATKAHAKLPESSGRIERAVKLVLAGDVEVLADGTARVASQSSGTTAYQVVNGHCGCRDFEKAPHQLCKHRIAAAIARRAEDLVQGQESGQVDAAPVELPAQAPVVAAAAETPHGIPAQHVVMIQGRPFVRFAGLLQMAHARGLVALTAAWTFNDGELSMAHAVATFADGTRFEEAGDASPSNVTRKVAVHFRRVALTRAKARALRDALGVDLVAVEELGDSD